MARPAIGFGALVLTQAAHSVEEYVGRLWESFPPARFVTGLISSDRELAFILLNVLLVAFGVWCLVFPVRRAWPSARAVMWAWIALETVNGLGHSLWALRERGYTAGVVTAPILLATAMYLAHRLRAERQWKGTR